MSVTDPSVPRLAYGLAVFSRAAGVFSISVGCLVFLGWAFDIALLKSVVPGLATMKANTAVCFVLAGSSLLLWHGTRATRRAALNPVIARYVAFALACAVIAVAAVTLSEDLFDWNAGIDQLLFRDLPGTTGTGPPGRMSPATASSFVLVGISLVLSISESLYSAGSAQSLAALAIVIAFVSLLGYLLHVPGLYRVWAFSSIGLHTALTFFVLETGLLVARPARGWARELVADTPGAQMGRRLLVSIAILLPALGWLRLKGEQAGWYGAEFGIGALVTASLILIVALIWLDTRSANRAEEKILRLNRVYAVLSGINALIVRTRDRKELFEDSCRIAVDAGGFPFAWIGMVDRDAMQVRPVAWAGDERGFLDKVGERHSIRNNLGKRGPVAEAVLSKEPAISNDVSADPNMLFREDLLERGIRSLAILPPVVGGEAIGVLALHAGTPGFFDEQEIKLFMEMAGDVAFAVDHIEKEQKLDYLAFYDPLTGLANSTLFRDRLVQHVSGAKRKQGKLALVIFDIERFKMINDTFGRNTGDELLRQVAKRLEPYALEPSRLARIGSDQFAVLIPRVEVESEVAHIHEDVLRECFGLPFSVDGEKLRISVRAGIAIYPQDGANAELLFNNAEAALKKAKAVGDRYVFYSPQINEKVAGKLRLETNLRRALEENQFVLYYQPKVDVETRKIQGVEALIRWQSPELGLVPPLDFIPLMEETGLILEVGAWALRQAVLDRGRFEGSGVSALRIAVNVSSIQLRQRNFVDTVEEALGQDTASRGLDLEITESYIMENIEANIRTLQAIRNLGVSIAIDDFGTGYSSLAYLAKLPVQTLKIDRSFIITMLSEPETMALVSTIVSLAHSLRLKVIAEGVESEDQAKTLQALRCDEMQGYLVSKPVPFQELLVFMKRASR